jgi:hypothetical protein
MTSDFVIISAAGSPLQGGVKFHHRLAEGLMALGQRARVASSQPLQPTWFDSTAPLCDVASLAPNAHQTFILPEDMAEPLRAFASWPQRKIVFMQNHFYASRGLMGARSYAEFGVSQIWAASDVMTAYAQQRFPALPCYRVPCYVDTALFKPLAKKRQIALLPRKRPDEALFIQDLFWARYPQLANIPWITLHNRHEREVAATLGESEVFLSLQRLEGLGLTALEALAAGCKVVGFGGAYAPPLHNQFFSLWQHEQEIVEKISDLAAIWAAPQPAHQLTSYHYHDFQTALSQVLSA